MAPVARFTDRSAVSGRRTRSLFFTIDNRASAVVVMVGCGTLSFPHGDRASAAVLLVGVTVVRGANGLSFVVRCVSSVFGEMGCSRAGKTAGISPFAAAAVLDRALAGTRR
jgi:hypothetical protein